RALRVRDRLWRRAGALSHSLDDLRGVRLITEVARFLAVDLRTIDLDDIMDDRRVHVTERVDDARHLRRPGAGGPLSRRRVQRVLLPGDRDRLDREVVAQDR